jgi:hypothetical protein
MAHACPRSDHRESSTIKTIDRRGAATVSDKGAQQADPPHPEPYVANWGPRTGPILNADCPGAIGVLAEGNPMPIGIAHPVGLVEYQRRPAQTFRLVIDKTELPGHWLCVGRRFVQLGEAAEDC